MLSPLEGISDGKVVALAHRMLELNKRLTPIRNMSSGEREELLHETKRTDAEIDQKVYELYGLTEIMEPHFNFQTVYQGLGLSA